MGKRRFPCYCQHESIARSRILDQYRLSEVKALYPTTSDNPGSHVLFKIDGGPDHLDVKSPFQLQAKVCHYLFLGAQYTTHVTQETDRD